MLSYITVNKLANDRLLQILRMLCMSQGLTFSPDALLSDDVHACFASFSCKDKKEHSEKNSHEIRRFRNARNILRTVCHAELYVKCY